MQTLEQLADELVVEACRDEVGLWFIIGAVRDNLPNQTPNEVRKTTLEIVRLMLESGRVDAGYYNPDGSGVVAWRSPLPTTLAKIEEDWTLLGRDPSIGEVVILVRKT